MITLLCITVQLAKLCIWKFILESRIAERLIFATSNVTKWRELVRNPESKALQILIWLALLFLQSPGIFDPFRLQRLSHGLYFTYKYKKKYCYVANSIIHSLEEFEDGRMDAWYGILPRVKVYKLLDNHSTALKADACQVRCM